MATGGGENFNPAYEAFCKHYVDLLTAIQPKGYLVGTVYIP